jgi:hypothetical protein
LLTPLEVVRNLLYVKVNALGVNYDPLLAKTELIHVAREVLGHAVAFAVVACFSGFGQKEHARFECKDEEWQVEQAIDDLGEEKGRLDLRIPLIPLQADHIVG